MREKPRLVIVHDLDVVGVASSPDEAGAPLLAVFPRKLRIMDVMITPSGNTGKR